MKRFSLRYAAHSAAVALPAGIASRIATGALMLALLPYASAIKAQSLAATHAGSEVSDAASLDRMRTSGASGLDEIAGVVLQQDTLPNGLRIVIAKSNELPLVEINLVVNAGSGCDPAGHEGLAVLTTKMMVSELARGEKKPVSEQLAAMGSTLSSYTAPEYSQVYARSLVRFLPQTLEILADIAQHPVFLQEALAPQVRQLQSASGTVQESAGEAATRALFQGMYGPSFPLTRNPLTPAGSGSITLGDIEAFHAQYFAPNNATLIITGNVDPVTVRALILDRFGDWKRIPVTALPALTAPAAPGSLMLVPGDQSQLATVRVAMPAPLRTDATIPAWLVFDRIMGEGRTSRLFRAFWGDRFIHPSFQSGLLFTSRTGTYIVSGYAPQLLADSVAAIVRATIRTVAESGVSPEELHYAQDNLTAFSAYDFATNRSLQSLIQEAVTLRYPIADILHFTDAIRAVRIEDVQAVASSLLASNCLWMAVAGDVARLEQVKHPFFDNRIIVPPARP